MWKSGLNIFLCLEFVLFSLGEKAHHYRYSFYWEYEEDALNIFHGVKGIKKFDPARSRLGVLMRGYYEDARIRTKELNNIRFVVEETFQYEVGYIMHEMYEKYKKLVEQFNKGERNRSLDYLRLYKNKKPAIPRDRLIFGNEKIERTEVAQKLYFEIFHLSNMIHEVTRKWGMSSKDQTPTIGKRQKNTFFYDTESYQAHQAHLQRQKQKYMNRLNKEKFRLMNQLNKEKKKKSSKSNELYGVNKDADSNTNDFIKEKMKEQGWEKWHKERGNGSHSYRPPTFVHDYGWDVTFSPDQ